MDDYELACIDERIEKRMTSAERVLAAKMDENEAYARLRRLARLNKYEAMVNGKWPTSQDAEGKAPLFPADKRQTILEMIDRARRIVEDPTKYPNSRGRTSAFIAGAVWAGGVYTLQELGVE